MLQNENVYSVLALETVTLVFTHTDATPH